MNRIRAFLEEAMPEPQYRDFVVVTGGFGWARVTHETARTIELALARWWTPRWIVFHDLAGSRIRVRTREIRTLTESTAAQRAVDRRIDRDREAEEKADRSPWDD